MTTRFVCLANSYKEGGRCVAGIELDSNNNPVIKNGHPKWIRPICTTGHGEVPLHLVADVQILDILEIKITGYPELSFQRENAFFDEDHIKKVGRFSSDKLDSLCRNMPTLFGNKGKAVAKEMIEMLSYSLIFVRISNFTVSEKKNEDNKIQLRLLFTYNGTEYNLPVTDPVFIRQYTIDRRILEGITKLYVCVSLGIVWEGWYYKLVAGVIIIK